MCLDLESSPQIVRLTMKDPPWIFWRGMITTSAALSLVKLTYKVVEDSSASRVVILGCRIAYVKEICCYEPTRYAQSKQILLIKIGL